MKKYNFAICIIAVFMTACMLFSGQPWTVAAADMKQDAQYAKTYMSEVKMFYGRSENQAKKACEKEGFIFCNTNLNQGAPGDSPMKIYLGYKTTTNPDEAITDLTLLDMKNTHFEEGNYLEYLDKHVSDFMNEANQLMIMVNEFRRQYSAGSPNARIAYDSFNLIYVDEDKSHSNEDNLFGNYLLNKADVTFFEKFIQRGNALVLNKIIGLLCTAVSDYEADGTTWVDRAKASEIDELYAEGNSAIQNDFDANYKDTAEYFIFAVRQFSKNYTEAKKLYDKYGETLGYKELEGKQGDEALEALNNADTDNRFPEYCKARETYALLDNVQYQKKGEVIVSNADLLEDGETNTEKYTKNMTLAEYILDLANDESIEDHISTVYPIVASLSPAQRVALRKGGLSAIVEGLYQAENYDAQREDLINKAMAKLKEKGCKDGRMYLWMGVDFSVFQKKVAYTSNDIEVRLSGDDLQSSIEATDNIELENIKQILEWVDVGVSVSSGIYLILSGALGGSLWAIGTHLFAVAAPYLAAGLFSALGGIAIGAAAAFLCAVQIVAIVAFAVSIAYMVWNAIGAWGLFETRDEISYSNIPDIVFDARTVTEGKGAYEVRYDAVPSNAGNDIFGDDDDDYHIDNISKKYAEMNAFQSVYDRWMTLYYSKAPAAGEPIEVKEGENPFVTQSGMDAPSGYKPLTLINQKTACNINDVEVDKKWGKPLYVFFPGVFVGTAAKTDIKDGEYIIKVLLYQNDKKEDIFNYFRKSGMEYLDVNLTPGNSYTYLGYQKAKSGTPITDIRVCSNGGEAQMHYGDALYSKAALETISSTTPYGLTIYTTKAESAGSPITDISIENQRRPLGDGSEPVCLFSGGNAVDFEHDWRDNINSKFTSDDEYFMNVKAGGKPDYEKDGKKKVREYLRQDDPVNGKYIYFWPQEQYLSENEDGSSAQQYISGFSYFLAGDENAKSNDYGNNYDYMQTFAAENGFELLQENGKPFTVMSDSAGEMTLAYAWRDTEGYPLDTYHFDKVHTIFNGNARSASDHGLTHSAGFDANDQDAWDYLTRENKNMIYHTKMYFGVSYTYNPKRAITGIAGLLTPYSETPDSKIQYKGLKTPAGAMLTTNVSLQGQPVLSAGIGLAIYNKYLMKQPLYTNYTASQKSDLPWMTKEATEIQTHHLLATGPRAGILPLKKDDISFSMQENPGEKSGYIPVCDMRTPSDKTHPMNFALDTTNTGSKYLYIYLKADAGGKEKGNSSNYHNKKKYIAGVFCGAGKNSEEALENLYANAVRLWPSLAESNADIDKNPTLAQLDEVIPVDISGKHPWYSLHKNNSDVSSLPNDEVVYGNEAAWYRWDDDNLSLGFSGGDAHYEANANCAYVGVVRTNDESKAVYGLLKYYTDAATASEMLNVHGTGTMLAGGPVKSNEGSYYLYFSTNSGTSAYSAPTTEIDISKEIFVNGFNTSFCASDKDYVNNELPAYSSLRMRPDEYYYFHLGYERKDLPYYEKICIGVGNSKNEAFADLIGTTSAFGAMDVNCNYNSFSKKWIAIGYRRTANADDAIRDVFLYYGDNPPEVAVIDGAYSVKEPTKKKGFTFKEFSGYYRDKDFKKVDVDGVPYLLAEHSVPGAADEPYSLNSGNGGKGLYLYYTTSRFAYAAEKEAEVFPITSMVFTYGDTSPRYASAQNLKDAYYKAYYAKAQYDVSEFENPHWECVLGVDGSPENWKPSAEGGKRYSLNEGIIPGRGNSGWHTGDHRIYMYVDRMDYSQIKPEKGAQPVYSEYRIRNAAKLPEFGYYSVKTNFGKIRQSQ